MLLKHAVTAALVVAATAGSAVAQSAPAVVAVTTSDYAFVAPDTVPAGLVTFEMKNAGKEPHHVWVARLEDGRTMADLAAAMQSHGPPPAWFVSVGGPQANTTTGSSNATLLLTPGNYVYLCMVPSPDGQPHVAKGMIRPFTVTGQPAADAALPDADLTIRLVDYGFELSAPLTAGRHVIAFENPSEQFHEVVLFKLQPGVTAAQAAEWVEKREGPPPMSLAGGVTGIDPGERAVITTDLAPGEYALICFLPDHKDGRPHLAHGMIEQLTVR